MGNSKKEAKERKEMTFTSQSLLIRINQKSLISHLRKLSISIKQK